MIQNRTNTYTQRAGFTMVELIVALGIMIAIMTLILFNYRQFDSNVILTNLAYDMALSVRKTQTYGISVKGVQMGSAQSYSFPFGIEFSLGAPQVYSLFADTNLNHQFDGASSEEFVESYTLRNPYKITDLCVVADSGDICNQDKIDIFFTRPNPDATTAYTKLGSTVISTGVTSKIKISSTNDDVTTRTIIVTAVGQISVQ